MTSLRRLSVCLSVCLSVFLSICLSVCWGLSDHSILFLSVHSSDYLPFHLSIYLSFLPFWPLVCLTVCLWVRLSNLSFCPLIDFGLFKIKLQDQGHFLYAFLKSFHVKKKIKIGKRKLRQNDQAGNCLDLRFPIIFQRLPKSNGKLWEYFPYPNLANRNSGVIKEFAWVKPYIAVSRVHYERRGLFALVFAALPLNTTVEGQPHRLLN